MNTVFLITARLKSTRLPEKALLEVAGRSVLGHLIDRLRRARHVDQIVICTSISPEDDRLAEAAAVEGVECFRGDEEDVLLRLSQAANACAADYVLNITADCPLVDPGYADRVVEAYRETGADLIRALELPHGAFCYGLRPAALQQAVAIKDTRASEVWGGYFTDTDLFRVHDLPVDPRHRRPDLRMTLDYPEDLEFFRALFSGLSRPGHVFSLDEVLAYLEAHPEVVAINRHRAEAYRRRFASQSAIALKARHAVTRAAVVGCGSIGQRHIGNLRTLGVTEIVALRTRLGHTQALDATLSVREVSTWDALVAERPDVAIISNPSALHIDAARRLAPHVRGLFSETPLAADLDGVESLLAEIELRRTVSFVGHNLSFHPAVRLMREQIAGDSLGAPLVLQCQVGHWLPDWHPNEDVRRAYFARPDLGGGVLRTLVHEIQLAIELLGVPVDVSCFLTPNASLPLDVDVMADVMIRHAGGRTSQIHLDYLQRGVHRAGTLGCERGWLRYDLTASEVVMQKAGERDGRCIWSDPSFDWNCSYLDEMSTFLRAVREGRVRHPHDVGHGVPALAVIEAALSSAASRRTVEVRSIAARSTVGRSV